MPVQLPAAVEDNKEAECATEETLVLGLAISSGTVTHRVAHNVRRPLFTHHSSNPVS